MKASSWRRMRQAFFIASSFLSWSAVAQVPAFVPYSGRLTDGTGWGQSTQLDIRVRLYDAKTGGNIISEGLHPATPVVDGYFTVNIGMCDAQGYCDPNPANAKFPTTLPPQLWLSIAVGGGAEMEPRQPVGSVPYALNSSKAQVAAVCETANALAEDTRFDYARSPILNDNWLTFDRAAPECPSGSTPRWVPPRYRGSKGADVDPSCVAVRFWYHTVSGGSFRYPPDDRACSVALPERSTFWPWWRVEDWVGGHVGGWDTWVASTWVLCATP